MIKIASQWVLVTETDEDYSVINRLSVADQIVRSHKDDPDYVGSCNNLRYVSEFPLASDPPIGLWEVESISEALLIEIDNDPLCHVFPPEAAPEKPVPSNDGTPPKEQPPAPIDKSEADQISAMVKSWGVKEELAEKYLANLKTWPDALAAYKNLVIEQAVTEKAEADASAAEAVISDDNPIK